MDVSVRTAPYSGPIRGAVLDWAGTAVDYGCIGPVAVFLEVFRRRGVEVTVQEARGPMGLMKKDHVRSMCQTPSVTAKWRAAHGRKPGEADVEPLMTECVARHAAPIPGLLEAVETLRRSRVRIGSSTGYTGPMMEMLVPEARQRGYAPDAVVCSSDVPAGRPFPWMCYLNAIRLQVYPMEAMVKIGDTVSDIQEGLNAGMWTIGVARTGNELGLTEAEVAALDSRDLAARLEAIRRRLREAGAHYVADGVADCPTLVEEINARLARGERP